MDMVAGVKEQLVFHMTGKSAGERMTPVDVAGLVPAALAPYRDLARLRYDFPLVLPDVEGHEPVSLSAAVGRLLSDIAPRRMEGERMRRDVLRIEAGIRARVARGEEGSLSQMWAEESAKHRSADATAADVLAQAGHSLHLDGAVLDCDARLPARYLREVWRAAQARKAREFRRLVDGLVRRLSDIRRAAFARSAAGRRPEALAASVGGAHADVFDFDAMSRLVARNAPQDELPAARRARIEGALSVLRAEPFYADADASGGSMRYQFEYDNCVAAVDAYRARLPRLTQTVKAIAIAELESTGAYVDDDHDPFFERYDEGALTPDDLALFPDYLVTIPAGANDAPENAGLLDMLSAGFPVKVLVHQTDLLEESSIGTGHFAFGVRSARLATAAMGLGGMFVLQATASDLHAMREQVKRGFGCRGPALFSIFVGAGPIGTLPPFLACAAARESRAFPAFAYDAAAGDNWATRFSLAGNRNSGDDWVVDPIEYADDEFQRAREPAAFTYADFAMCDPRYARHFVAVPRDRWHDGMLPVAQWLALPEREAADRVPFLWGVDTSDRLHRVIVDARMMQATKRCLLLWHRLQEHAGIHDSHAERLLAHERAVWEATRTPAVAEDGPAAGAAVPAAAEPSTEAPPGREAPPSDDPWIETARCPSCNECQTINDKMFAYNENKQAYIKDLAAGTYRQLVEAAEACQVAIIHPGKPRNPGEPGLAELVERAKPFL